ncbi:cytochrome c oxidase accessory protein CcoG [Wohlfahrtiimonas chitiniclastica]|uniref:cytochrome c oxidase accessory protein CcoG n=1 Tax=Wohlfahrtiimonas chitiniclastica TaxID=400946 RepID=UPI0007B69C01|nr:cytochrome c oxidase accessory protein CcoG [Wohlfahrtiimonas chitiniclastica]KZX36603.1 (Fe-S)-binding protein [Wohlfahrtiimonas chitiniclastica]
MSDQQPDSLYQKRIPIFTRDVKGTFRRFKSAVLYFGLAVFYLLPWLPWPRAAGVPDQAVLFDIAQRRFYVLGLDVDIQNIMWLAGVLMIFAFLLFFITNIAGRVFCGYFCFQTIWTDFFMKIETWIQGGRNKRSKLYEMPWNGEKLIKVGGTWLVWLLVAIWTGFTFTAYWVPSSELLKEVITGDAPFAAYGAILFITTTTFVMAGFAREQVCSYMCPYARFQGVMFDKDTLVVAYDEKRGEGAKGRAKPTKELRDLETRHEAGHGDCVDCDLCVQVCPVGIDIREGLNYKCITCGLCIDACNTMMTKTGYPTGLIRYDSLNGLEGKKTHFFKPRNIGYGLVILVVIGVLIWSMVTSAQMSFLLEKTRTPAYTVMSNGLIQNRYMLKLNNLTMTPKMVEVKLVDAKDLDLVVSENNETIAAGDRKNWRVLVHQTVKGAPSQPIDVEILVKDDQGKVIETHHLNSKFVTK